LEELWEEHLASEFKAKSAQAAVNTMVDRPVVNHVPVMTGGVGRKQLAHFYGTYFIPHMPPDTEIIPISRTIGHDRLVDEFVFKFTHTLQMDWLLPGVAPTNKPVEVVKVVVVEFRDGKIAGERIHWDQASVLVQLGLLEADKLPVRRRSSHRAEGARPGIAIECVDEANHRRSGTVAAPTARCVDTKNAK
jgi:carboxymethylenebutenolidase